MKAGCRVLDIRISGYINHTNGGNLEYWCSHTFLTFPLEIVLCDILRFVKNHPSEVIIIDHRADTYTLNGDKADLLTKFGGVNSECMSIKKPEDLKKMTDYFIDCLGEHRIAFDYNTDMTIGSLAKRGKNIVLL